MTAVPAVLFAHRDDTSGFVAEPAGSASLLLENENGPFRINRDFKDGRMTVEDIKKNKTIFDDKGTAFSRGSKAASFEKMLDAVLGLSDVDLFRGTAFIGQADLKGLGDPSKIKQRVTGSASQDYDAIIERLRDRYFAITKENPWNVRAKTLDRSLEKCEQRIRELQQIVVAAGSTRAS